MGYLNQNQYNLASLVDSENILAEASLRQFCEDKGWVFTIPSDGEEDLRSVTRDGVSYLFCPFPDDWQGSGLTLSTIYPSDKSDKSPQSVQLFNERADLLIDEYTEWCAANPDAARLQRV